jgi:hypothetical protein
MDVNPLKPVGHATIQSAVNRLKRAAFPGSS